jgi:hypothetical protein
MGEADAWWNDVPPEERGRNIDTDKALGLDPWRPLHSHCYSLNVQTPKTDTEMQRLGELWNGRYDVELGLWGHATQDFESLRHFPGLERLNVQCPVIRNIEGLRHVADTLKKFDFANTTVRHSLRPVANCTRLESLHLQRHKKDFNALHALWSHCFSASASRSISVCWGASASSKLCISSRSTICLMFRH